MRQCIVYGLSYLVRWCVQAEIAREHRCPHRARRAEPVNGDMWRRRRDVSLEAAAADIGSTGKESSLNEIISSASAAALPWA